MKPYGHRRRSKRLHGKECVICNPPLLKKVGQRRAREENKRLIDEQKEEANAAD